MSEPQAGSTGLAPPRRVLIGILFGAIALIALAAYLLKLSGLCFSARGYLSDETLIKVALQREVARGSSHPPAFQDADAYLSEYPTCCEVDRWGSTFVDGYLLNALFGRRFFAVEVRYPVAPEAGYKDPFYNAIYVMDCCGAYIPDVYGIGGDRPVEPGPPRPRIVPPLPE